MKFKLLFFIFYNILYFCNVNDYVANEINKNLLVMKNNLTSIFWFDKKDVYLYAKVQKYIFVNMLYV